MHSCHTALSNYSTIAATQVMEFQLKYDSFRICFCSKRELVEVVFHVLGGRDGGWWGGSHTGDILSSLLYIIHLSTPLLTPLILHQKGIAKTLFLFGGTLWLEPGAGQKMGCYDKGLCDEKSNTEPSLDLSKNNYATCCAK